MVLGEPQILGQLKDAYRIAQETGSTGTVPQQAFSSRLLDRQTGALRNPNRRQCRFSRIGHGESGAPRVR